VTVVAKFFDKKIKDWLKNNSSRVAHFQEMSGAAPIIRTIQGRYGGT